MRDDPNQRKWWQSWWLWGAVGVVLVGYLASGSRAPEKDPAAPVDPVQSAREVEEACATRLQSDLQAALEKSKQEFFNAFHPIGTAKSVVVHDVSIVGWKRGKATGRDEDILQLTMRFTIYWEGPITKDGFTKVGATWDGESQRWLPPQLLATNGMTNSQATEAFIDIAGAALAEALRSQGN
jgi:hypothetical protein